MRVRVELTAVGARLFELGGTEIRGDAADPKGEYWSLRLTLDGDESEFGTAKFTVAGAEERFTRDFWVRGGFVDYARCTPLEVPRL